MVKKKKKVNLKKYAKYEYALLRKLSEKNKKAFIIKKKIKTLNLKQKHLFYCLTGLNLNLKRKILNNFFIYNKNKNYFFQKKSLISKRSLTSFFRTEYLRKLNFDSKLKNLQERIEASEKLNTKAFLFWGDTEFRRRGPLGLKLFKDIRRKVTSNFCFINQTRTNIYITLCNYKGNVIFSGSGGILKVRKRREAVSTEVAIKIANAIAKCILNFSLKKVCLVYRVFPKTFFIKPFLREIKKISKRAFKFRYYLNLPKIAHNGCRFRKKKRK